MGVGLFLFAIVLFVLVVPPLRWLLFKSLGLTMAVGAILSFWTIVFHFAGA